MDMDYQHAAIRELYEKRFGGRIQDHNVAYGKLSKAFGRETLNSLINDLAKAIKLEDEQYPATYRIERLFGASHTPVTDLERLQAKGRELLKSATTPAVKDRIRANYKLEEVS